jgi:hypothetical protein
VNILPEYVACIPGRLYQAVQEGACGCYLQSISLPSFPATRVHQRGHPVLKSDILHSLCMYSSRATPPSISFVSPVPQDLNRWDRGLYRLGSQVAALDAAYLATAYSLGLRDVAGQGASVKLVHPGAPSSAAATGGAGSSSSLLSLSGSAAAAGGASADAGAATGTALGAQVGSQQQQPGSEQQGTAAKPQSQSQHQEGKEAVQQGHPGQQQQQTPGAASGQVSEGESATELAVQRRHLMQEPDQQQQQQQQQQQSIGEGDQNEVDVISGTALAEQRRSLKQQSLRVQRQSLAGERWEGGARGRGMGGGEQAGEHRGGKGRRWGVGVGGKEGRGGGADNV